jgi:Cu/Ag efflux pump CusA
MVVQVAWPGATVEEMQSQVVDKIERKAQETPELDYVRSYTRPGNAVIFVNIKGEARGRQITDAFYQVRKKIADIRHTLPAGVVGPFFNDEFGDTYVTLHALTGSGFAYPEQKAQAKRIRDVLLRVPGVEKVDLLGTQDEKLFIEISSKDGFEIPAQKCARWRKRSDVGKAANFAAALVLQGRAVPSSSALLRSTRALSQSRCAVRSEIPRRPAISMSE